MKKETIRDTVMMEGANHFDVLVMRHSLDGSLQWAADVSQVPVINGGDGKNEHPTQALLDMLTLYLFNDKKLDDLNIGFGGDLSHGRTVRSLSLALSKFDNITLRWAADDFLGMPTDLEQLLKSRGVNVIRESNVKDVMKSSRFYYMTRPQIERMNTSKDALFELIKKFRIDLSKVDGFDVKILHPLPVDSEVAEIDYKVFFSPVQGFFRQAENGIFLRKALLYEMLKQKSCGVEYQKFSGCLDPNLEFGNNRLCRYIKDEIKGHMFIDTIPNGLVLDHLVYGNAQKIADRLGLIERNYDSIPTNLSNNRKSFLKTNLGELSERELKSIALISPDPTINFIKDGKVVDKFVYLLCKNDNCVSRVVNEDVPPKFYNEDEIIKCRYCRRTYTVNNLKVSERDLKTYVSGLPRGISLI